MLNMVCYVEGSTTSVSGESENGVACQYWSTSGRDYKGMANTTAAGIPCQRWSDTKPHDHPFTYVGDHNHCRNPVGTYDQVWCFTADPEQRAQQCSVPFCPPLKVLDFSLDNNWKPDANNTFTHASVQKENFPSSFTICLAFMVEQWGVGQSSPLFLLLDSRKKRWLYVELFAAKSHTEFTTYFLAEQFTVSSPNIFFPMQWTRICFSFNSETSLATLVVDGDQLGEEFIEKDEKIFNLNMIIGWNGIGTETPGRITDVNIFSVPLSNLTNMEARAEHLSGG